MTTTTQQLSITGMGQFIATERKQRKLSQSALAKEAKVSRETINRIENAAERKRDDTLAQVLESIGYKLISVTYEPSLLYEVGQNQ